MSGLGKGISAIGGPLVTGALGVLGGGLAGMLKENETLKASLESVKSSLQGAFAPITEAVLPLVDTFAQTISGLAQTVAPLLSGVLGGISGTIAGMLSGVNLSGLLTPLTAGLDGILSLFSKLGQATGTWMQGLDLSGLAGSFAGLAAAIGPVVKPFADAVQLAKKHEKKHTEKGMGEVGRIRRKEMMPMGAAA